MTTDGFLEFSALPVVERAEMQNAIIRRVEIGFEDHGIFTLMVHLDYGGAGQGFGGFAGDVYDKAKNRRVGVAFGAEIIMRLLALVGVSYVHELTGRSVRALHTHSEVVALGNYLTDKWLCPRVLAEETT